MNDMRGVRIVLDPHAIRVGDEETSVSARRIEETIGFVGTTHLTRDATTWLGV